MEEQKAELRKEIDDEEENILDIERALLLPTVVRTTFVFSTIFCREAALLASTCNKGTVASIPISLPTVIHIH